MAESEKELKSLLMKVKAKEESEKVGLKLNIQKTMIMASSPMTSWQIDGETIETVRDFIFLGSKITADGDCSHEIKRHLLLGRKAMSNLDSILKSRDVQFSSVTQSFPTLCDPMNCSTPGLPGHIRQASIIVFQSSLKLRSIQSMISSNHLILCHRLFLLPQSLPASESFPMSQLFSCSGQSTGVSALEHPGLISFRMDWLDLLAVQGTLKSLLQHHRSKASISQSLAFFTVQLSHPYMTTGKTIALTRQTLLAK